MEGVKFVDVSTPHRDIIEVHNEGVLIGHITDDGPEYGFGFWTNRINEQGKCVGWCYFEHSPSVENTKKLVREHLAAEKNESSNVL